MPTITTKDGIEIFYKDWGTGQPIVFSHGWPLSADDWDTLCRSATSVCNISQLRYPRSATTRVSIWLKLANGTKSSSDRL